MRSPSEIVPAELLDASRKADVLRWLMAQPWPAALKSRTLHGWGIWTGVPTTAADYALVEATGFDAVNPVKSKAV